MTFLSPSILAASLLALGMACVPLTSFAQNPAGDYDFDPMLCAPETRHTVLSKRPSLLLVLDTSGSMDGRGSATRSKLELAKEAIEEVALSTNRDGTCDEGPGGETVGCDLVAMGLGRFSNNAQVSVDPGEDKAAEVISKVKAYKADGGTYIGKAAKLIHDNPALGGPNSIGIGVLVSDGQPTGVQTTRQTLHYLCKARDRKPRTVLSFAVGFGRGADPEMNNLFAAAGGTGFCCKASGGFGCVLNPGHPARFDPCTQLSRHDADELSLTNLSSEQVFCQGGLQADSGQALKDAFLAILGRSACTFPLEIPEDYPAGQGADPDPRATKVKFNHRVLGDDIDVPYVGDSYLLIPGIPVPIPNPDPSVMRSTALHDSLLNKPVPTDDATADRYLNEGWMFANPDRSAIILTADLCQDVVYKYEVTEVFTQVACLCENTNEACEVPCFREKCLEENDCVSKTGAAKEECEKGCRNDPSSACQEGFNELYGRTESQQVGRCSPGVVQCVVGKEYCAPLHEPQPEICNGMDDSCSGKVDDLSLSTTSTDYATQLNPEVQDVLASMSPGSQGPFCGFKDDACGCAGAPNGYGTPTQLTAEHGFKEVLRLSQLPENTCRCVETLEGPEASEASGPGAAHADPQAGGCASTPGAPVPHALLLPLLLGWLLLRRKRHA